MWRSIATRHALTGATISILSLTLPACCSVHSLIECSVFGARLARCDGGRPDSARLRETNMVLDVVSEAAYSGAPAGIGSMLTQFVVN